MKKVLTPLVKHFCYFWFISMNISSRCSYSTEIYESETAALIISNEEMEDTMKIVKSLDESGLPVKEISETIKNETKKYKKEYLFQCY